MKMRRNRYGGFSTPKKKVIRNPIRVKERVAKKGGRCAACRLRYEPGDPVTVVNVKRKTFHRNGCVPANVDMPTAAGPVIANTPTAVVQALSAQWSPGEAKLVGMMALENAMVVVAKAMPVITEEIEKAFDRYEKLKSSALRPGSENEGNMAMREALIKLVRTIL
jgi:hypothetical protein